MPGAYPSGPAITPLPTSSPYSLRSGYRRRGITITTPSLFLRGITARPSAPDRLRAPTARHCAPAILPGRTDQPCARAASPAIALLPCALHSVLRIRAQPFVPLIPRDPALHLSSPEASAMGLAADTAAPAIADLPESPFSL